MSNYIDLLNSDKLLTEINKNKDKYCIIHYSCESFYQDYNAKSPRITAIAIQNFANSQTELFSIHKQAELNKLSLNEIESNYDRLEKAMLKEFFDYIKHHKDFKYVHWNMRDSNFGFSALNHRYKYLKGNPTDISDENKIDLARLLKIRYGPNYCDNPKMFGLAHLNDNLPKNMLSGKEEALAFENKDFVKLSFSTAAKVDFIADVLSRTINHKLKTKNSNYSLYIDSIATQWYVLSQNKTFKFIFWILSIVVTAIISHYVTKILG